MNKIKNKKVIALILAIAAVAGLSVEAITNQFMEHKFNALVKSEFEDKTMDELFNDMLTIDEKERVIHDFSENKTYQIATGEELRNYLESNDINLICINGTCFSNTNDIVTIPKKMYENDIFYLKENTSFSIDSSDINYQIIPNTYADLENYNVRKMVGIDHHFYDDETYCETYSLEQK